MDLPSSNSAIDGNDPEIDCRHGAERLALSASSCRLGRPIEQEASMAVTLNRRAFEHAKKLIGEGKFVFDERDAWSEHQPSTKEENELIRLHGLPESGRGGVGVIARNTEEIARGS